MSIIHLVAGSYTRIKKDTPSGLGIYILAVDSETGHAEIEHTYSCCNDPSYMVVNGDMLYVAEESRDKGGVSALKIEKDYSLSFINHLDTPAGGVVHVQLWPDAKQISCAHYGAGAMSNCSINPDGSLEAVGSVVYHSGKGPDPQRQKAPHVHSSWLDPNNNFLLACDLGTDGVYFYSLNQNNCFTKLDHILPTAPGRGPRHIAFSPDGKYMCLITEMGNTVATYPYGEGGAGRQICEISTLPNGFSDFSKAADVHYSADGRYVYASNRGYDTIAVFSVDGNGALYNRRIFPAYGVEPRNFCLFDKGRKIAIANQTSGNVAIASVDTQSGEISTLECSVEIPQAVFVLQLP